MLNMTAAYATFTKHQIKCHCRVNGLQGLKAFRVNHMVIEIFLGKISRDSNYRDRPKYAKNVRS